MDMHSTSLSPVATEHSRSLGFLDLAQMRAIVHRNRYILAGAVALGLVAALIATLLMPRIYTANGSVQIEQPEPDLVEGATTQQPWAAATFMLFQQTQVDILRSRAIAERVVDATRLAQDAAALETMKINADDLPTAPAQRRVALARALQDHFSAEIEGDTQIVGIEFSSPDPELSARMANALLDAFLQRNLTRRFESSAYARTYLQDQITEARAQLEDSERKALSYARQAKLLDTSNSGNAVRTENDPANISITTADLVQLNSALNDARQQRIAAEGRWRAAAAASPLSLPQTQANVAVQRLQEERAKAQAELIEQRERYTGNYPTVQRLQERIGELDRQILKIANNARESVRQEYTAAVSTEQALASKVAALRGDTLAEQDRSVEYNILRRQADTNRQVYDSLLQRLEEVNQAAQLGVNNVTIVDRPVAPEKPSSPRPFLNVLVGLVLGALLGALLSFLRESSGGKVVEPRQLTEWFGLPVLGVIPISDDADGDPAEQVRSPLTPVAEAYQSVAATIRLNLEVGGPAPVLMVTSSKASEGKSLTAFALAHYLSSDGSKVVIVDCDLRRGSLHRHFDQPSKNGVSETLSGQMGWNDAVVKGSAPFDYIRSGQIPADPVRLLASPRMRELIDALRAAYDIVLIDGPPLLGLADSQILAGYSDLAVMIVEAGSTPRQRVRESLRRLQLVDANVLGGILTKFDAKDSGMDYAYGYDYYSYRGGDLAERS